MKKTFKKLINIAMIFIVLLSSMVYASENTGQLVGYTPVDGDGTEINPYIIDANAYKEVYFAVDTIPFDFKVTVPGIYTVNYDSVKKEITFTLIMTGKSGANIALNKDKYSDINNWQLGIKTKKRSQSSSLGSAYSIKELSSYETLSNIATHNFDGYWMSESGKIQAVNDFENGESADYLKFGALGNVYGTRVERKMNLSNVTYERESGFEASDTKLYYFTNAQQGISLFTSLGFVPNAYLNNSDIFTDDADEIEFLYNKDNVDEDTLISTIAVEKINSLSYRFEGNSNLALDDSSNKVTWLEAQITRLLVLFGDRVLLGMLRKESIFGSSLTIDALIFDEYEKTKLDLYSKKSNSALDSAIKETVNYWFNAFQTLAYIVYLIILVYIGIMIVLNSGTGNQDKWKSYIGNWVVGLLLLAVLPRYGIPFLFKINSAFVSYIGKGHETMKTYYNLYEPNAKNGSIYKDIMGSDSTTISVEELIGLRTEKENDYENILLEAKEKISKQYDKKLDELKRKIKEDKSEYSHLTDEDIDRKIDEYLGERLKNIFPIIEGFAVNHEYSDEQIEKVLVNTYTPVEIEDVSVQYKNGVFDNKMQTYFADIILESSAPGVYTGVKDDMMQLFSEYSEVCREISIIDEAIKIHQSDLLGMMRAYAGRYQRIVFAILWYVLFFQLISLAFIYFKRVFMVAILIAIFPLIMMSYAVDKMADGKSQTFSLWLKELLSNIFIQSIHAIIYVVLVEMGLNIYAKDEGNWLFLMASLLMLIPSESLLKDIFGLNGSTVGKLGGAMLNTLTIAGSAARIAFSGKGKKDASVVEKNKSRMNKLQKSQNRADKKAEIRRNKQIKLAADNKNGNATDSQLRRRENWNKVRDKAYAAGSNIRSATAKVAPHVDSVVRNARNVAGVAVGTATAIAGGDVASVTQGAQIANAISGKTKKAKPEDINVKNELKSAYKRNKSTSKSAGSGANNGNTSTNNASSNTKS